MNKIKYLFYLFFILLVACKKDKPQKRDENSSNYTSGLFILNEGNYTWSNASISYYDFKDNKLVDDVFFAENQYNLGDVAQSMLKINNSYFIVVNNSKKIEVVDAITFKTTSTITGFKSPRYCALVGVNKLYVTDLYDNAISVVNLIDGKIQKKITCSGWTEQLLQYKNKVYVTNIYSSYLYVIDAINDEITDSISVGYASNSICIDSDNNLWIACFGDKNKNIRACIKKINPINNEVVSNYDMLNPSSNICTNFNKDTIYFLSKGVFQISKNTTSISNIPLINDANTNYYALGIMPKTGDIFVSNALDYVQRGTILRYTNKGNKTSEFKAGIIPNGFVFQ